MWWDGELEAPRRNWENTPVIRAESEPQLAGPVKKRGITAQRVLTQ